MILPHRLGTMPAREGVPDEERAMKADLSAPIPGTEALHEDLRAYVKRGPLGVAVVHPLVFMPHFLVFLADAVNQTYVKKAEAKPRAIKEKDWMGYIFLHERYARLDALQDCVLSGLEGKEYWECLAHVWSDSARIHTRYHVWRELWCWNTPGREAVMEEHERQALAVLPDMIRVWRGSTGKAGALGMSWTTDREMAVWFARRYTTKTNRVSYVTEGTVPKTRVLAHFLSRNENEIVAFPEDVVVGRTVRLPAEHA